MDLKVLNAVLVAGVMVLGAMNTHAEEPFPAEVKVAVVDVSQVFLKYKRVPDVQRQVDAEFEPKRKSLEKEGQDLNETEKQINELRQRANEDRLFNVTQSFQKRLFEFRKAKGQLEYDIVIRMRQEMKSVLNEIRAAIRKEAEKGGYHLVIRAPDPHDPAEDPSAKPPENVTVDELEKMDPKKRQELEIKQILAPQSTADLLIRSRRNPVVYGALTIDITSGVLKQLNDDYAKRMGPK